MISKLQVGETQVMMDAVTIRPESQSAYGIHALFKTTEWFRKEVNGDWVCFYNTTESIPSISLEIYENGEDGQINFEGSRVMMVRLSQTPAKVNSKKPALSGMVFETHGSRASLNLTLDAVKEVFSRCMRNEVLTISPESIMMQKVIAGVRRRFVASTGDVKVINAMYIPSTGWYGNGVVSLSLSIDDGESVEFVDVFNMPFDGSFEPNVNIKNLIETSGISPMCLQIEVEPIMRTFEMSVVL